MPMWISIRLPRITRWESTSTCSRRCSRSRASAGWTAHVMEQLSDNRLIRPRAEYQGPIYPNKYVPMEQR